jgi:hypothetical protein
MTWGIPLGGFPRKDMSSSSPLIHVKRSLGAKGFETVAVVSIAEVMRDSSYKPILDEIRRRCRTFLALTSD